MTNDNTRRRQYPYQPTGPISEPDYMTVARALTDAELEDEILGRRGLPAYQAALLAEAERRAGFAPTDVTV